MAKRMTNTEFLNYSYNIQNTFFCEMTVFQYLAKIAYIDLTKKFSFFFIATHKKIDYNLLPILLYLYHTVGILFKKSLKLVTMPRIFFYALDVSNSKSTS